MRQDNATPNERIPRDAGLVAGVCFVDGCHRVGGFDYAPVGGSNMIAISIFVKGGVAYVLGGSEGVAVKLEDADNGETAYYQVDGAEVYETDNQFIISAIENELKCLEG